MFMKTRNTHKVMLAFLLITVTTTVVYGRGASASASGSSPAAAESRNTITIHDDANRDVTIALPITRVALLDSGLGAALSALGVLDRIVGTHQSLQTKLYGVAVDVPMVATNSSINYELLAEVTPQLALSATSHHGYVSDSDHLDEFGIQFIALDLRTPSRMRDDLRILGRIFQREAQAQKIIDFYDKYQRIIDERLATVPAQDRPKVYFEMHAGALHTGSPASQFFQQVELAGGINIARGLEDNILADDTEVSAEWVAEKDPDFILREVSALRYIATDIAPIKAQYDEICARPGFATIKAVTNKHILLVGNDILSRPGYIVGVCYLAKSFYPNLFTDFDIEAINREWFAIVYPGFPLEGIWTYSE
jgi:iron complex transport system substrate-binding protein